MHLFVKDQKPSMLSEGHDKTPVTQQLSFPEFSHGNEAAQAGSALAPEVTTRLVGYQSLWVEGQGYFEKIANKVMTVWLVSNFLGASSLGPGCALLTDFCCFISFFLPFSPLR